MSSPSDAGLQAERTGLAWSRTSLGVAANAALLAERELSHLTLTVALVPAALALLIAAVTALYGRHRTVQIRREPLPASLGASVGVPVLGAAVVLLAVITGTVMLE